MSSFKTPSSRWSFALLASLVVMGCSVVATSPAPQCATDSDCYSKFGGGYSCQAGGCVTASAAAATPRVVAKLDECRSTQECVASLGEGWLCRRNREDPQKSGKCQQLTPTSECTVVGDYKNDQAILLGAVVPGKDSPQLRARTTAGLNRGVADWEAAIRQLQQSNVGADAVAPPRPFAVVACTEDMPEADLRNLFLNSGVALVIGPTGVRPTTDTLSSELTNAKLVLLSPTSISRPTDGANIGTFFVQIAGGEAKLVAAMVGAAPTAVIQRASSYASVLSGLGLVAKLTTYTDPASFPPTAFSPTDVVAILGDGEVASILPNIAKNGVKVLILPTAIPDVAAAFSDGFPPISSFLPKRSTSIPSPAIATTTYGEAEAYDAFYVAMASLAGVGDDLGPDSVKEEALRASLTRVASPNGTALPASAAGIRDIVKTLRVAGATIRLDGATGSLAVDATSATQRDFTPCKMSSAGCN